MAIYTGIDSVARNVKGIYVGVDGVARKVVKGYIGVDGVARLFWSGGGMPISELPEGAKIQIAENGVGRNFYLAKHNYESSLNGSGRELLVRSSAYDNRVWHTVSRKNNYPDSAINTWLNGTYLSLFDSAVQALIGTTKFKYTVGGSTSNKTVSTLSKAVFLLALSEIGPTVSTSYYNNEGSLLPIASTLKSIGGRYWLRSVPTNNSGNVFVAGSGSAGTVASSSSATMDSLPCFTLPATALVNPTPNADGSYTLLV